MEFEGELILDRKPARRWVSTIAVIIPVVACVAGVAWFVRAFISPPTIAIPGSMTLAAAPPAPIRPAREEPRAPETALPAATAMQPAPTAPSAGAPPVPSASFSMPMIATLSAAPPSTMSPTAFADPVRDGPAVTSTAMEAAAMPIAGPVPMPRPRPDVTAAVTAQATVPLPRARPAEEEASPASSAEPAYGRHSVD